MRDMAQQIDTNLMIPVPGRSNHNLDQQTLTTVATGNICPIFCMETVPGGSYDIQNEMLARFQPLRSPVMHKMNIKAHYYFVPYRLLWDNWENFIMQRKDFVTNEIPVHPFFTRNDNLSTDATNGKTLPLLADYFGFKSGSSYNLNPFAFSAYQFICSWYYRHKSVKDEYPYKLFDGEVSPSDFGTELAVLRQITYEDDYFNSALPTPQEGEPVFMDNDAQVLHDGSDVSLVTTGGLGSILVDGEDSNPNDGVVPDQLFARVRIIIEEWRRAKSLQQYVELNNHARTYIDFLKGHYNVDLQDYRLGIPEYITGFSQPVIVSDVTNQSDNFQGRITGNGTSYAVSPKKSYYAREHGMIIGVAAVTYKPTYLHALPKIHTKTSFDEYFNPLFDGLGEQVVKNIELHAGHVEPELEFGYVPKHYEYRTNFDMCTGEARTSLAHWHLARNLSNEVELTQDFYDVVDERRIFVYENPDFDAIILQVYHNIQASLPMGKIQQAM